jgi:S23 ribosomal protein.
MATHYKDLIVWRKSMLLVKYVYRVTQTFPHSEVYGLVSQMRRASVSIPSNIAEGQTRKSPLEFAHFLSISHGSLAELETQMIISCDLGYVTQAQFDEYSALHGEVSKMLTALKTKFSKN